MRTTIEGKDTILDLNRIVLLVIDEAHRATGAYAYCNLINYLEKAGMGFRIVALSATPVSKLDCLQAIVDVLRVSQLEVYDEDDEEVKKHTHEKNVVEIIVDKEDNLQVLETHLLALMELPLAFLK
jgi:ATP-dependent DNA helicase MPH1